MSIVTEIAAVAADLLLLTQRDPDALARRPQILATKTALLERIRAENQDSEAVTTPSRDDDATIPCPRCRTAFTVTGRRRYCSDSCRRTAWARRHRPPPPPVAVPPPPGSRRTHTVYECDTCGQRSLGDQRCEDCGTFMRRIGLGGPCPACDEPVAANELTEITEAT